MKTCYKCKESKQVGEFNKCSCTADGLQPLCRVCDNKQSRARYQGNKQYHNRYVKRHRQKTIAFLNRVKSQPCADCGKTFHPVCMDFDHSFDKKFNVSQAKSLSIKSISKEIEKCEVVCSNCHRLRTYKRRNDT